MPDDELDQIIEHISAVKKRKLYTPRGKNSSYAAGNRPDDRLTKKRKLLEFNIQKPLRKCRAGDVRKLQDLKAALAESWPLVEEAVQEMSWLTVKQIKFAKAYAENGRSNKAEAVRLAGYEAETDVHIWQVANDNLTKPGMEKLIQAFEHEAKRKLKMTVDEVVKYFSKIADSAMAVGDFTNANRSMENLAKYLQMFVTKTEITHRTVSTAAELDARIAELTKVLADNRDEVDERLSFH